MGVLLLAAAFGGQKNQSGKCPADNIRLEQVPNGSHQGSCVIVPSRRNVSVREIIGRFHKLLLQFFLTLVCFLESLREQRFEFGD